MQGPASPFISLCWYTGITDLGPHWHERALVTDA